MKTNPAEDQCEYASREVPLKEFNRFDPKYVSIGPKALRELSNVSNLSKCATLRHAGRYGGSLIDRGLNPVLKRASPPSVATLSRKLDNEKTKFLKSKQVYGGSNKFIAPKNFNVLGSEDGSDSNFKRTVSENQPKNVFNNMTNEYNKTQHTSTVYSIETPSYQPSSKKCLKINSNQPSAMSISNYCGTTNSSILKQPLPEIPRSKQPLSASNLENFNAINNFTDHIHSKVYDTRMESSRPRNNSEKTSLSTNSTKKKL